MSKRLRELQQRRAEAFDAADAIVNATGEEPLTEADQEAFDKHMAEVDRLDADINRLQGLEAKRGEIDPAPEPQQPSYRNAGPVAKKEFESLSEFIAAAAINPNDQRLTDLWQNGTNAADQSMGEGSRGGFAIPQQFRSELLEVEAAPAAVRPRANVIPAGTPPDSAMTMPALDQTDTENMYGGVEVNWINEGGEKPETDARLREVTLTPQEVAAYIPVTDKLLRNWQAAGAILSRLLRNAIFAAEDDKFMNGAGAGAPLGFINADAALTVNRSSADDVDYPDLVSMEEKLLANAEPVFITTRRMVARLRLMKDDAGQYIYSDARMGMPATLMGYPLLIVPRMPSRGNKGDLVLVDLNYYLIKDGSGPFIAASEHVHFKSNKTVIKAFWNVDGQPWLNKPITQENGDQQSPFVLLDVPS